MKIEMVKISEVIPYDKNPRRNDDAVKFVKKSIEDFGFRVPIVVDKHMVICSGHTRLKAAKQLGLKEVPVHIASDLNEDQIKALRIADNSSAQRAEWDITLLEAEMKALPGYDFVNYGIDYIPKDIEQEQKENDVPATPEIPRTVKGDIYLIGRHRVMCGSSTDFNDVDKLMNKQQADIGVYRSSLWS
jgi:hypothetical protein